MWVFVSAAYFARAVAIVVQLQSSGAATMYAAESIGQNEA